MAYFSWVAREQGITDAELTVRVQAVSPNDNGLLLWDAFMPKQPVGSVKINTITSIIAKRWTADRREWNARGRYIPMEFPGTAELEMIPIESYFKIGEREIQDIVEQVGDNMQMFRQMVGADIPTRTETLAMANYRRLEVDVMTAWATGNITVRNPVSGGTYTVSYALDATRYQTAGVAWTGGSGGTAYNNFVAWLLAAYDRGISIAGAMMRQTTREAIRTSAPNLAFPLNTTVPPILADVEKRIQDEIGGPFQFATNERTVDIFATGGPAPTNTKIWPAQTLAIIPAGGRVGYTAAAPVARAYEVSRAQPQAKIDIRGMTAYAEVGGAGRDLTIECQANFLPVPIESQIYVMNAGI